MPQHYYTYYSKETIKLAPKAFAGGGEGDLFKITSPSNLKKYVAKIYHPHKQTEERERKTKYLIEHPPLGLSENGSIVWIIDALYDSKDRFVGFIMPFVKGEKLEILTLGKLSRKLDQRWKRLDLKSPDAMQLRMRICFNLAAAIYQMHATEHYVLVDMKPDNIIIQPNGLLAIVDTDSVEVIEDGVAIFPAPVATPEYTPPEFYTKNYRENSTVGEPWDRFGLGVIIYKLLFGIHPFTASAGPPYDGLVSLHEKIETGLFVHSISKKHYLKVIPPPHKRFDLLNEDLQNLFMRCFEDGHEDPNARPTANEWCSALLFSIGDPNLEDHFAHILGLSGHSIGGKFKLPSAVFKQTDPAQATKRLLAKTIEAELETPPALPPKLQQYLYINPTEGPKGRVLENKDYLISWGLTLVGALVFFALFSNVFSWLLGDFWLSSTWIINLTLVGVVLVPQLLGTRLVAIIRAHLNEAKDLSGLWKEVQSTYPTLMKEVGLAKHDLLTELLVEKQAEIDALNTEKEQTLAPVTAFLESQDKAVQKLAEAYQSAVTELDQRLFKKALKNDLLKEVEASNLMELDRKLELLHKVKIGRLDGVARMELKSHPRHAEILAEFADEQRGYQERFKDTEVAIEEKANELFDMNYLIDHHQSDFNEQEIRTLKQYFATKGVKCIFNIGMIFPGEGRLRFMYFDEAEGKEVLVSIDDDSFSYHAFVKLYGNYEASIERLKKQNIKTKADYIQAATTTYELKLKKELDKLKTIYQGKIDVVLEENIKAMRHELTEEVGVARKIIRKLKEEKRKTLEPIKEKYSNEYSVILEACKAELEQSKQALEDLEEVQKIRINDLLANSDAERIKVDLQTQIETIKANLIELEHYDPSK